MTKDGLEMTEERLRALPSRRRRADRRSGPRDRSLGRLELIRSGAWPTPTLRIGKLIRVPTAPSIELVGLDR
jgi:hypothetical protein